MNLPYAWDRTEAEEVKQKFRECRPAVPLQVVVGLWRYWRSRCPTEFLFGDTDDDLALLLHAKAFGQDIPVPDAKEPLARLLARAEDVEPLVPEPLGWGPQAALSPDIRAALSSSLVRAWIAVDDQGPVEVLVVGEGLPEIRQQIVQLALTTSLRVNGLASDGEVVGDLMAVGLIRISAGLAGKMSAIDLPSVFSGRQVVVAEKVATTARGALRDLVNQLRVLERETNLVQVSEIMYADQREFTDDLRSLADRAAEQTHKAFLRSAVPGGGIVTLLPYLRTTSSDSTSVAVTLHPDLLSSNAYEALEEAHQRVLARRLTLDAKLRRDRIEAEIRWHKAELEAFQRASKEERRAMWDETVLLVERFDERLGMTIRIPPEEHDTESYFLNNVPQLISMREGWAKRMNELVEHLENAVSKPHAPAKQLAAGRFVDAVLRGVTPDESQATETAFLSWRDQVAPMLWFEWRDTLRRQEIAPADLFTRHTAFVTRYLSGIDGGEAQLVVQAYSVVDESLSAVLADTTRRVLVVRDATDHAEPAVSGADDDSGAERAWAELVRIAEDPTQDERVFSAAFLQALRAHPRHVVRKMSAELHPSEPSTAEADAIENEERRARRAMSLSEGMDRALIAMGMSAFATARQCLDEVQADPSWEARAWLLRAIVECVAAELPHREIPDLLATQMPGLPSAALRALDEAASLDRAFTTAWLRVLPEAELSKGIRRLFHGIPRVRASTSERERAVWLFRGAIEAARLARQLDEAADDLAEEHEATDVALVKLGKAVEDVVLGMFVGSARNDAQELFEVLTGEEPPKYGRVKGV